MAGNSSDPMSTFADAHPSTVVRLPEVLGMEAAGPLAGELLACRGRPMRVDASAVERIGALCLQVLLSARKTWTADGVPMAVDQPSPNFQDALVLIGAPPFVKEPARGDERAA